MSNKTIQTLIILITLLSFLVACGNTNSSTQTDAVHETSTKKLNVVATTGQVADAVNNIGGDKINFTGMFGPGVDPHLYVPTEGDVTLLGEADVIFYNGLHLEAQMTRVLNQMAVKGVTVIAIGEALPQDKLLTWDDNYPHDPHVWNDPLLWSVGVEAIRDTLMNVDSDNADYYQQNAEAYLTEIADTHAYIEEQMKRIPEDQRVLVTAHDAFGYLANAYGFEVHGLQGISTESEASTADVQELAQFIVDRQIPAIFVESSVSSRNIEAVQAAVSAQGFDVEIGGELFSDALGNPGTPEGTYIGMLHHNIDTIASALGDPSQTMK